MCFLKLWRCSTPFFHLVAAPGFYGVSLRVFEIHSLAPLSILCRCRGSSHVSQGQFDKVDCFIQLCENLILVCLTRRNLLFLSVTATHRVTFWEAFACVSSVSGFPLILLLKNYMCLIRSRCRPPSWKMKAWFWIFQVTKRVLLNSRQTRNLVSLKKRIDRHKKSIHQGLVSKSFPKVT